MNDTANFIAQLKQRFTNEIVDSEIALNEVTIEVAAENIIQIARALRDEPLFHFEMLIDLCGVDYLDYGVVEWATDSTTATGFSRAVEKEMVDKERVIEWNKPRFAVVYHLLSISQNRRLRMRCFLEDDLPAIESLVDIWAAANWFEREAFDLYGILFKGHPDLRRILTDYGFVGHPFRKDFPLSGHVEMRYDAKQERVIYEAVDIEPRVLVPKVIRVDHRYQIIQAEDSNATNS